MNTTEKEEKCSPTVIASIIKGIFSIIVAVISVFCGGEKLVKISANISQAMIANVSSINKAVAYITQNINIDKEFLDQFPRITPTFTPETQLTTTPTITPTVKSSTPHPDVPYTGGTLSPGCVGSDWEYCWNVDVQRKELIWIGDTSADADIGFAGTSLFMIRDGYVAKVELVEEMWINICKGAIDDKFVFGECPIVIRLAPGKHTIISPGPTGGFRIYN